MGSEGLTRKDRRSEGGVQNLGHRLRRVNRHYEFDVCSRTLTSVNHIWAKMNATAIPAVIPQPQTESVHAVVSASQPARARSSKSDRTLRIGLESNDHCSDTHSTPQLQTGLDNGPFNCQSSILEELEDIQVTMSQYARELVRSSCRHDPNIFKVPLFRREGMTA